MLTLSERPVLVGNRNASASASLTAPHGVDRALVCGCRPSLAGDAADATPIFASRCRTTDYTNAWSSTLTNKDETMGMPTALNPALSSSRRMSKSIPARVECVVVQVVDPNDADYWARSHTDLFHKE